MTDLRALLAADEWELEELPVAAGGVVTGIPIGYRTRIFLEQGAAIGVQRTEAVRAARNLLGAGIAPAEAIAMLCGALERSAQDTARPWRPKDVADIVDSLLSKPAPPPAPFEAGTVIVDTGAPVASEDESGVFQFVFETEHVEIEMSRVIAGSRGTLAWVVAKVEGAEVGAAECEIRTAQGVGGMWRFFDGVARGLPWPAMLEQARRGVLVARRTGGEIIDLRDVVLEDRPMMAVAPLLLAGRLNVVFAAGGSGKSLLACLWALMLQEGRAHAGMTVAPGNVLYLDWEQGPQDAKRTLMALASGMGIENPSYRYLRCTATLAEMGEELGRRIVEHDISLVIIDSLTFALGGEKNESQTVLAGIEAMRGWPEEVTVVALDHVNKADRKTQGGTTIGSIMVENAARNMLRVIAWQDPESGELHQVLRQTKQNKGLLDSYGLRYTFEPDSLNPEVIFVEREDPPFDVEGKMAEKPAIERVARGPQRQKVYQFLKTHTDRMWSKSALARELDMPEDTVRSALSWLVGEEMVVRIEGSGQTPNTYGTKGD